MTRFRRSHALSLVAGLILASFGVVAPAGASEFPGFSCAVGHADLTTPPPVSVRQGQTISFVVGIARIGCPDPVYLDLEPTYLPPASTVTFSENPTTADSVTVTVTTSKSWPAITPVGGYAIRFYATVAIGLPQEVQGSVEFDVTASDVPISRTPVPVLAGGTLGSSTARVRTTWSAVDPDGIAAFRLQRQRNGGGWSTVSLPSQIQTAITESLAFGVTYRYRVRATDKHGNVGSYTYGPSFRLKLFQQTSAAVTSTWRWTTVRTVAASGGSLTYQPYSGSDFTFKFTGASVAWISTKGPTRTNVTNVFMDGRPARYDIDLSARSTKYRQVAFVRNYPSNAKRTLLVWNFGRIGHSRIDLDALVVLVLT